MDGSRYWAELRGRPAGAGLRAGARAVRRVVSAAPGLGVGTLTLLVLPAHRLDAPSGTTAALLRLLEASLLRGAPRAAEAGIRIRVVGRRDRLPAGTREALARAEALTERSGPFLLRLAIDYSARDAVTRAVARSATLEETPSAEGISRCLGEVQGDGGPAPDVDLLVRTGASRRLEDFVLWECAYAELVFSDRLWPDFTAADLARALDTFRGRDRRFGRLTRAVAG